MVSSNKERGAPKRAQRYKGMEMRINEATITNAYLFEMERLVEWLCTPDGKNIAEIIEAKFSYTGSGMLRAMILANMSYADGFPLSDFLAKETKAAEVVARMIKEPASLMREIKRFSGP